MGSSTGGPVGDCCVSRATGIVMVVMADHLLTPRCSRVAGARAAGIVVDGEERRGGGLHRVVLEEQLAGSGAGLVDGLVLGEHREGGGPGGDVGRRNSPSRSQPGNQLTRPTMVGCQHRKATGQRFHDGPRKVLVAHRGEHQGTGAEHRLHHLVGRLPSSELDIGDASALELLSEGTVAEEHEPKIRVVSCGPGLQKRVGTLLVRQAADEEHGAGGRRWAMARAGVFHPVRLHHDLVRRDPTLDQLLLEEP